MAAPTQMDALNAWRRSLGAPEPDEAATPEGPGFLMQGLDVLSRPVSGVMGGLYGVVAPEVSPGEGLAQGLRGDRYFSAYDFAVDAGMDPESRVTRWGSLAADVLNPLDPLNYVGAGFTKAGRLAKALPSGSKTAGKVLSRVEAAEKGLWSPLTVAGQRVVPKGVSTVVARPLDAVENRIKKSKYVETLGQYFGGVRKFEAQFPGVASFIRGRAREANVDMEAFAQQMVAMEEGLLKQGLSKAEARKAVEDLGRMIERPEVRIEEINRELELTETALAGGFTDWLPPGTTAEEAAAVTKVNIAHQQAVDRRVAELTQARRAFGDVVDDDPFPMGGPGAGGAAPEVPEITAEARRAIQLEDEILESYLARSGGEVETRVRLADLRKGLNRYSREEQDALLLEMQRDGKLVMYPLDDPQDIFEADEAAKLMLGNNRRDLVYLKPAAIDAQLARMADEGSNASGGTPALPPSELQAIDDELHVLKSVQAARFAENLAPMDVLAKRRELLLGERDQVQKLWEEAGPPVKEAYQALKPLFDETRDLYLDRLRKLDGDVQTPVLDYLKHMYPAAEASLPANLLKSKAAAVSKKEALARELAGQGLDDLAIEQELKRRLGAEYALAELPLDKKGVLAGDLDAFKQRQYNMTIDEFNELALEKGLPQWENYTTTIAQHMRRDANEWAFAYDVHDFVRSKPGWTLKGEDYAALDKAGQRHWMKLDFHVPWIKPEKNPFKDLYVKKEVHALMQSQLRGMGKLLTDDGLNGLLGALSGFRQWWVAWTLAPFPSTRVRDLVSDMVLNHQAGLNPAADLAKMMAGESAYGASLALNTGRSKIPSLKGMFGASPQSLENLLGRVNAAFPDTPLSREKLIEFMEIEGVLGASAVRDLDLAKVLSEDPLVKSARGGRSALRKAGAFVPFHPNVEKSALVKGGFKVAQATADFTRGALFIDTLKKVLPEAQNLEEALQFASAKVRRHLFDYTDLTQVERDVLKNIIPFYTFTAKNLPLQLTEAATDPGKFAWANRLYQGAWDQYDDDEVAPEDLPAWLESQLGLPLNKTEHEDGTVEYSVWTPRGWLPQTELNEMADLLRGEGGSQLLARLTPLVKEPFEQLLNRDAFTMREIEDGTIRDMFGVPVPRRVAHLLQNLRLVTEMDRLDPGGAWTKIGQHMGWWEDERPHRWTAPGPDRATRFLTGLNLKGIVPQEQQERNMKDAEREMNAALSRARWAFRKGQTFEGNKFMEAVEALGREQQQAAQRWHELRRRNALELVAKDRRSP